VIGRFLGFPLFIVVLTTSIFTWGFAAMADLGLQYSVSAYEPADDDRHAV